MNGDEVQRAEIEKLLPWYVTGRLDSHDVNKVARFLREHPDVAARIDLIRAEREHTIQVNEALGYPPPNMLRRLLQAIPDAQTRRAAFLASFARIFTQPTARSVRWAALLAGLIVIAQAAVIVGLLLGDGDHLYREARGPTSTGDAVSALVVFSDQATAASIARVLTEFDASIVDGPKPGNAYKVRLRVGDGSQAGRDALLRKLAERRDVIRIVLPAGN
jgi:anti-sigma factor RsiW